MEIVVGADGSAASNRALTWAVEEAKLRGDASVVAVHAYASPTPHSPLPYSYTHMPAEAMERLSVRDRELRAEEEEIARQHAERIVHDALDKLGVDGGPVVKPVVVVRDPAKTLIEMSREADMVVVGSRGHGGFKGLLMGSVSQQVLHHASCPVVVIR